MYALRFVYGESPVRSELVLPSVRSGSAVDYWPIEVWADDTTTLTGGKAWLSLDPAGAAVAISVPDPTARAQSYEWTYTYSSLTYTAPETQAAGLTVPTLAPGQKTLVVLRRDPTAATEATPELNRLRVGGIWT